MNTIERESYSYTGIETKSVAISSLSHDEIYEEVNSLFDAEYQGVYNISMSEDSIELEFKAKRDSDYFFFVKDIDSEELLSELLENGCEAFIATMEKHCQNMSCAEEISHSDKVCSHCGSVQDEFSNETIEKNKYWSERILTVLEEVHTNTTSHAA